MAVELFDALSPLLAATDLELIDVEQTARLIRVTVDHTGGVDLEALAMANRLISAELDRLDPLNGHYTLEVSSPGVERRLRTPAHFARSIGEVVTVRTHPERDIPRRIEGKLTEANATDIRIASDELDGGSVAIPYDAIERARTVFVWGPAARGTERAGTPGHRPSSKSHDHPARTRKVTTP